MVEQNSSKARVCVFVCGGGGGGGLRIEPNVIALVLVTETNPLPSGVHFWVVSRTNVIILLILLFQMVGIFR